MKVIAVHNFYRASAPSGENVVFEQERDLLTEHGHEVKTFTTSNEEIVELGYAQQALAALEVPWSVRLYRRFRALLRDFRPQIVHFHSVFPRPSPSVLWACKREGIPSVMTIHNFRIACANGLLFRDGHVCEDCLGGTTWSGIRHGCYTSSVLRTVPIALTIEAHRRMRTWHRTVDRFITMTEFGKAKAVEMGIPPDRIRVKPHFLSRAPAPSQSERTGPPVFIGRLSVEKGVRTLLAAWKNLKGVPLIIVGDGPLKGEVERASVNASGSIQLRGLITRDQCLATLSQAPFLVVPSVWYETFGLVLMEAFACGTPVVASRLGVMAEMVRERETGILFSPGSAEDLAQKVRWLLEQPETCRHMGEAARREFEARYTQGKNYRTLMQIYEEVAGIVDRQEAQ